MPKEWFLSVGKDVTEKFYDTFGTLTSNFQQGFSNKVPNVVLREFPAKRPPT